MISNLNLCFIVIAIVMSMHYSSDARSIDSIIIRRGHHLDSPYANDNCTSEHESKGHDGQDHQGKDRKEKEGKEEDDYDNTNNAAVIIKEINGPVIINYINYGESENNDDNDDDDDDDNDSGKHGKKHGKKYGHKGDIFGEESTTKDGSLVEYTTSKQDIFGEGSTTKDETLVEYTTNQGITFDDFIYVKTSPKVGIVNEPTINSGGILDFLNNIIRGQIPDEYTNSQVDTSNPEPEYGSTKADAIQPKRTTPDYLLPG